MHQKQKLAPSTKLYKGFSSQSNYTGESNLISQIICVIEQSEDDAHLVQVFPKGKSAALVAQ